MPKMHGRYQTLNISIPEQVFEQVENITRRNFTTKSAWLRQLIIDKLEEEGIKFYEQSDY